MIKTTPKPNQGPWALRHPGEVIQLGDYSPEPSSLGNGDHWYPVSEQRVGTLVCEGERVRYWIGKGEYTPHAARGIR